MNQNPSNRSNQLFKFRPLFIALALTVGGVILYQSLFAEKMRSTSNSPTNVEENDSDVTSESSAQQSTQEGEPGAISKPKPDEEMAETIEGADKHKKTTSKVISIQTEIDVDDEDKTKIVNDQLKKDGIIDEKSEIQRDDAPSKAGTWVISRHQQVLDGIKIHGAVVVLIEKEGKVIEISGTPISDIKVDTEPKLSFEEAFNRVNEYEFPKLAATSKESLAIIEVASEFRLAWVVNVVGKFMELVFIDAEHGVVLERLPTSYSH